LSVVPEPSAPSARSWAQDFGHAVCACLNETENSVAGFDFRYHGPGEQEFDDHLFLFAPAPLQITGGPDDGEVVCEPMAVDIEGVQQLFTEVEFTSYRAARGDDLPSRRRIELSGRLGQRNVTVFIFDEPFDDAEVQTTFDDDSKTFLLERDSLRR
jgi:hypothetical protein